MRERSGEFWAGTAIFGLIFVVFLLIIPYAMWNDHSEKQAKIVTCSHASDVVNCLKQIELSTGYNVSYNSNR